MAINQHTRELQNIRVTVRNEARAAVSETLREVGIDSTRLGPVDAQGDYVSIELCLTGPQAAKVIGTVLPAVVLRARGYCDEVVVASLGPCTDQQPCCQQSVIASDRGETLDATE